MAYARSGYIAVDRDPRETAKSINLAAEAIRNGVSAIAFPEGTRSKDGVLANSTPASFRSRFAPAFLSSRLFSTAAIEWLFPAISRQSRIIIRIKIDAPSIFPDMQRTKSSG